MFSKMGLNRNILDSYTLAVALVVLSYISESMGQLVLTKAPQNVAGLKGDPPTLTLDCEFYSPDGDPYYYKWAESGTVIFNQDQKTDDHELADHFSLNNPGTEQWSKYGMEVDTSDMGVARQYQCHAIRAETVDGYADVLLLESQPTCGHNYTDADHEYEKGDITELWCTSTYSGSWPPSIVLTDGGGGTVQGEVKNETLEDGTINLRYTAYVELDDHNSFTCKTQFEAPENPADDQAANAPEYTDSCQITLTVNSSPGLVSNSIAVWMVCFLVGYFIPSLT